MTDSSIFFNQPTVIDHSWIGPDGCIYGGSVNPNFIVTGKVNTTENVVLDFSAGKKQIKDAIDAQNGGFDHKCWIIPGISSVLSIFRDTGERVLDWNELVSEINNDQVLTVTTTQIIITAPKSAFKFFANESRATTLYAAAQGEIESWLNTKMPEFQFSVRVYADVQDKTTASYELFTYVHGLKNSTSWGCQNIAHGHTSFISVDSAESDERVSNILKGIAKDLRNTVFVNAENFYRDDYFRTIEYQSVDRGQFKMAFHQTSAHKLVVLETETTIEHIIEFVAAKYQTLLKSIQATRLYVSEGLSKGAVMELNFEEQE